MLYFVIIYDEFDYLKYLDYLYYIDLKLIIGLFEWRFMCHLVADHSMVPTDMPAFSQTTQRFKDFVEELDNFLLADLGKCEERGLHWWQAIGLEGKAVIGNLASDQKATYNSMCQALWGHDKGQKHVHLLRHAHFSMFI